MSILSKIRKYVSTRKKKKTPSVMEIMKYVPAEFRSKLLKAVKAPYGFAKKKIRESEEKEKEYMRQGAERQQKKLKRTRESFGFPSKIPKQ